MKERAHHALASQLTDVIQQELDRDITAHGTVAYRDHFGARAVMELMPYVETAIDIASGTLIIHEADPDCAHLFVEGRGATPRCAHCEGWFHIPV